MIYLDDALDSFIALLGENEYFDDVEIVKAFGDVTFETVPERVHIAVGVSEMNFTPPSAGQDFKAGEVRIFADIFVPYTLSDSADVQEIISEICSATAPCGVLSISASKPYADKTTRCTVTESAFTFCDLICFGGQGDE